MSQMHDKNDTFFFSFASYKFLPVKNKRIFSLDKYEKLWKFEYYGSTQVHKYFHWIFDDCGKGLIVSGIALQIANRHFFAGYRPCSLDRLTQSWDVFSRAVEIASVTLACVRACVARASFMSRFENKA